MRLLAPCRVGITFPERPEIVPAPPRALSRIIQSGYAILDNCLGGEGSFCSSFWKRIGFESGIKEKFDLFRGEIMLDLRQVFSLTDFLRNHKEMVARVTETHKPVVLTVKGKPALVIQDAGSYQELIDRLERAEGKGNSA